MTAANCCKKLTSGRRTKSFHEAEFIFSRERDFDRFCSERLVATTTVS